MKLLPVLSATLLTLACGGEMAGFGGAKSGKAKDADAAKPDGDGAPDGAATDQAAGTGQTDKTDVGGAGGGPAITDQALAELCADTTRAWTTTQSVAFPKPTAVCEWGKDGNLEFKQKDHQGVISARREEIVALDRPVNAQVCSMSFAFKTTTMRYDDEIMLLYNGVTLMGSQDYTKEFGADAAGLVRYDWTKLVGKDYENGKRPTFFIDSDCGADCALPPTETVGLAKLKVKSETVRKVTVATQTVATPGFTFVTTGDNDAQIDCLHEDFSFDVDVTYVTLP